MAEAAKMNNDVVKTSPVPAGFFYRRIGGTLFKVRVYTGSGYADTLGEKMYKTIHKINENFVEITDILLYNYIL